MKVHFNLAFDGPAWPGVLWELGKSGWKQRQAVAGEAWVGPRGLLSILETQLGLVPEDGGQASRVAGLVSALGGAKDGRFWSESAAVAPFAVARTLLRWRDELMMWGWAPAALKLVKRDKKADRLDQLASLTTSDKVARGMPDRLLAILADLESIGPLAKEAVTLTELVLLAEPAEELPTLWQRLIEALQGAGVTVREQDVAPIKRPKGDTRDLVRAFRFSKRVKPGGDGSLQLVRPAGPLDAAQQAAVWLGSLDDLEGTVIIGGDEVLDAALAAQGLPTTGASSANDVDPLLQVLPLVVELGWSPPQPQPALDLLLMREGPVPGDLAKELVEALGNWPAVGSDDWEAAIETGLNELTPNKYRTSVQKRLEGIFTTDAPVATRESPRYPASELLKRLAVMDSWLGDWRRARQTLADPELLDRIDSVLTQCQVARELMERSGLDELSEAQLSDVLDHATSAAGMGSRFGAQAGLVRVSRLGAIAGPARRILWWSFTRDAAERLHTLPLSSPERSALKKLGVVLPVPGDQAERHSALWRRPFEQATERLVLVCPLVGEDGEEQFPHPIWDEVVAPLDDAEKMLLELAAVPDIEKSRAVELLPEPEPLAVWKLDASARIPRSESYSPNAFNKLLGCPLSWVLNYPGRIRGGASSTLGTDSTLHGSLAHRLAEVLLLRRRDGEQLTPELAQAEAEAMFDEQGPRLAAEIFAPGNDDERIRVRRGITEGIGELFRQLDAAGATIGGVEESISTAWRDVTLGGRVDLLVAEPRSVIDLKWRGAKYRRSELEDGTSAQLATYARVIGGGNPPPVAYFTFTEQMLITTSSDAYPAALGVTGPDMNEVWQSVELAVVERWAELDQGNIWCGTLEGDGPSQEVVKKKGVTDDGVLRQKPPCKFCEYAGLCLAGGDE